MWMGKAMGHFNRQNIELSYTIVLLNKTYICMKLGFFSGISSHERQNFDMMKPQLSFVDCFTASRRFGQKIPELLPES